jgi:NarL family two-component system response regulator LiaR
VHTGRSSLHPDIALKVIRELNKPPAHLPATEEPLTEREVEVLKLVARGLTNQEIADRLGVSERTVRTHISNILGKLHLANRTQAALYALREGIASLDES